jgi:sugar lactone lactonase YvrE
VSTLAGTASIGSADGSGAAARFYGPVSPTADRAGNIYVADAGNHTVRKVTPEGVVTTWAGAAGVQGTTDDTGGAARFHTPGGVAASPEGVLYVADTGNNTIRQVSATAVVTTLAGMAAPLGASADGMGAAARFSRPTGIAVDLTGNLAVADTDNHTVRTITPAGLVVTLAGTPGSPGSVDDTGAAARFNSPYGVALDATGNMYVADTQNQTIRRVSPGGTVTTLAGTAGMTGATDGTGPDARFSTPVQVATDPTGNVYLADGYNGVRRLTPSGTVTTLKLAAPLRGQATGLTIVGDSIVVTVDNAVVVLRHGVH